jgi:hypothetical protein
MAMLANLIDLLTCGSLEPIDRDEIAARVQNAPQDPAFSWVSSSEEAMSIELIGSLVDYVATGDKIDEVHELIQDMFEGPFPDFPHDLNADRPGERRVVLEYYEWMEQELSQWVVEEGGYDLIDVDDRCSENMNVFVVFRRDTDRIIQIGTEIGFRLCRPLDYYRKLYAKIEGFD